MPNLDCVERSADAPHWVHHDKPERINKLLNRLLRPRGIEEAIRNRTYQARRS